MSNPEIFVEVKNLCRYFTIKTGMFSNIVKMLKAVDNVSFNIYKGETLGIVGESGCGKTTLGKTILRLIEPTSGSVMIENVDIAKISKEELRQARQKMQMVFQDPFSSLNGRITIGTALTEPMKAHKLCKAKEATERAGKLLETVGLHAYYLDRYPHEFSGGQRQRIAIARALVTNPKFIICDEAVSALDVSVQADILNLLKKLKRNFNLSYLFISHDLSVVHHISDRIGVMYLGKIIELGDSEKLFDNPMHPYTQALFSAVPIPNPKIKRQRIVMQGDVPSPVDLPPGCRFYSRCPMRMDICRKVEAELREIAPNYFCACHLYGKENNAI